MGGMSEHHTEPPGGATPLHATPIKLRNGSWGARVHGLPSEGSLIRIEAKNGKSWDAIVARKVWEDRAAGVAIVATRSANTAPARSNTGLGWPADDCPTGGDCWSFAQIKHCRHCGK